MVSSRLIHRFRGWCRNCWRGGCVAGVSLTSCGRGIRSMACVALGARYSFICLAPNLVRRRLILPGLGLGGVRNGGFVHSGWTGGAWICRVGRAGELLGQCRNWHGQQGANGGGPKLEFHCLSSKSEQGRAWARACIQETQRRQLQLAGSALVSIKRIGAAEGAGGRPG